MEYGHQFIFNKVRAIFENKCQGCQGREGQKLNGVSAQQKEGSGDRDLKARDLFVFERDNDKENGTNRVIAKEPKNNGHRLKFGNVAAKQPDVTYL
ncbi:MAG: hypothetical protein IKC51_05675 [Myxococcaceae bacterium]|nr:hypothetical protein [Myxococcaceae bacterium]